MSSFEEKIYRDDDVSLEPLKGKTVAIIGYGSQGRAQSLNIRDSGIKVVIGCGDPKFFPDWERAEADGHTVMSIEEAVQQADVVHVLLQDPAQPAAYRDHIHAHLRKGQTLSFCHGFAILYGTIQPPKDVDVTLFVPNGPGPVVRQKYLDGAGIYGCVCVEQDYSGNALKTELALAKAVGSTRAGTIEMSFQHETEGDNFEEQALYGGTIHLMREVYQIMADEGYPKSFAYAKAIRSIRSVIDDIDAVGIETYLSTHCSRTCEYAVRHSGPRVINREAIRQVFDETERGIFARNWLLEFSQGMPTLHRMRRERRDSDMEKTGRVWRETFAKEKDM